MARPIDQEMIIIEERVCYSSQKERAHHAMGVCPGKDRWGGSGGRGNGGSVRRSHICGVCEKEGVRQG